MKSILTLIALTLLFPLTLLAEGSISGQIFSAEDKQPIDRLLVGLKGSSATVMTDKDGRFKFSGLPNGIYAVIIKSSLWEMPMELSLEVKDNDIKQDYYIKKVVFNFKDIVVYGASKAPEKITESPAAINIQYPSQIEIASRRGQLAQSLQGATGVDILQNGSSDFIVNTRGFNGGLHRRLLVLQDGRDAAMPLLGAQEWNSFAYSLEDYARIELVRGPSAALYGANAYNGVLNLTTYAPKEVLGTKISVLGGEQENFRADIRHAGMITDELSYKITIGHSRSLNYSRSRTADSLLEYPELKDAIEARELTDDDRQTFSYYGSARLDYDFAPDKRIVGEFGMSRSGNETFVFGLGRTLVKDVDRPYLRLAYNSSDINIHAHYMKRHCKQKMWLMVPNKPLLDDSEDMMLEAQHNFRIGNNLKFVWGASYQKQLIRTHATSIPFDVDADYTGIYGQSEWQLTDMIKLVGSGRVDFASIHSTQFSPRGALVISPSENHQFRLTASRSFQRPNYSELYRETADKPAFYNHPGPPVDWATLAAKIQDSILALSGTIPELNMNFEAKALGNDDLKVEKNIGFEIGYKGIISERLYITCDIYYNRLNDFITNFLPGINPNIDTWEPGLTGDLEQYNDLVKDMIASEVAENDIARMSIVDGQPMLVVSNTNVGKVDQYGMELGLSYYFTEELLLDANYSYYDYEVVESNIKHKLVPNTSPHKMNMALSYIKPKAYDASVSFSYTEGFDWLAGSTFTGFVPSYALLNLSAGYYFTGSLHAGLNVFNLLNRKHYQIFGGTYLPRLTTLKLTYEF